MIDFPSLNMEPTAGPKLVPQSREAEEAVLGSILINPDAYFDVAEFLQPEDFYIHRHRWIWQSFTRLQESRNPIDYLTVTEDLDQQGQLSEIGGPAYITALINNVPSSLHSEAYGRIVEDAAVRRRMIEAANDIVKLAYDEETALDSVMGDAEKAIFGVSEHRMTRDLAPIKQVLSEYYDRVGELAARDEDVRGVPTGFVDLSSHWRWPMNNWCSV
jgi:replicative DNA helicase